MQLLSFIQQQTGFAEKSVRQTLSLFEEGATIPFLARYRKEQTGNLDEVQLEEIAKAKNQYETLEKRKESILKSIEEQDQLSAKLKAQITASTDLNVLEDLYLPFKKKRKTKAETARQNGLEPLAKMIMAQNSDNLSAMAKRFVLKEVASEEKALEGARYIISEWVAERSDFRQYLRRQINRYGKIVTKVIKTKKTEENAQKFKDYFEWDEALNRIPSHRFLAIQRAEREGFIRVKVQLEEERVFQKIAQKIIKSSGACAAQIQMAIKDSYKRLLFPSLSNEALSEAKNKADAAAIAVFAKNLKQLLLGAPLGEKRVLAIDPGFKSGCKIVCLDQQGALLHNETLYPHPPQSEVSAAIKKISTLTEAYKIEAIAIGNGTASRETERLIKRIHFKNELQVFVVSEAGASIYSASKIAREEFPNYDVTVRGSVSIGRRLQDPLAELVKIDAKSIGIGQYQHDVNQGQLQNELDRVVENVVNTVGVNLNTASKPLLRYVSGIGDKLAGNVWTYREKNGALQSREALQAVPRLGAKAYEQSAGFLRIKQGQHPLDDSAVHPERYALVEKIARDAGMEVTKLIGNKAALQSINLKKYCTAKVGLPTLNDIFKELEKPGRDIREKAKVFSFNQTIKTITDLEVGQVLPGIVNNITNFGCFVDVGIKESGLVHVSNLADEFVRDVNNYVQLQQQVQVKVLEVDVPRKRIQLKLISGNGKVIP